MTLEVIINEVQKMQPVERIELLKHLFQFSEVREALDDEELFGEDWEIEIQKRLEAVESGTARLLTGKELSNGLRARGVEVNLP